MCNFTRSVILLTVFALFEIYVKFCSAVVIYAVLSWDNFRRELTHFWVENFQAFKFASVEKRTNIRYVSTMPLNWKGKINMWCSCTIFEPLARSVLRINRQPPNAFVDVYKPNICFKSQTVSDIYFLYQQLGPDLVAAISVVDNMHWICPGIWRSC